MSKLQERHELQDAVIHLLNDMLNDAKLQGVALETFLYYFDLPRAFYGIN